MLYQFGLVTICGFREHSNITGLRTNRNQLVNVYLITGCYAPSWHADGYCDDGNNVEACHFDGGDCCGPNVKTDYCVECECLDEN